MYSINSAITELKAVATAFSVPYLFGILSAVVTAPGSVISAVRQCLTVQPCIGTHAGPSQRQAKEALAKLNF